MRRHLFSLFGGIALLATLIPAGSAAWMFAYDEASDKANVLVQGDPIRDNHVLGDDNDPDYAGQTFYDVYFAAQVTPNSTSDEDQGDQILSRERSSFSLDEPCYGGMAPTKGEPRLGRFENPSASAGEGTEYYRVFAGRTSITHNELEAVNQAFKAEVIDRTTSYGDGGDESTFPLSLIGWSPMLVCNFAVADRSVEGAHAHWPKLDTLKLNTYDGSSHKGYIRVDGYYPNDPSLVLFSANNLLENYSNFAYPQDQDLDGNGRADIVLYPILSTGKNNHAADVGETLTDAIGVDLFPGKDSSGNEADMGGQGSNATYDPRLSAKVMEHVSGGTRIEVFRYENVLFEENSGSSLGFTLDPNRSKENGYGVSAGWPGTDEGGRWDGDAKTQQTHGQTNGTSNVDSDASARFYITNLSPKNDDDLSSISIKNVSAASDSITAISGRYNIYFVDLVNDNQWIGELNDQSLWRDGWLTSYTATNGLEDNEDGIASAFSNYGITPYQIRLIQHTKLVTSPRRTREYQPDFTYDYDYYAQTRALAIVLERVYEPRLVLGDTGSASFSNGKAFTQVAGPTRHTYTLMNVNLDGNAEYSLGPEYENLRVTNDIFAIMLANQEDFTTYRMEVGGQAGPTGNGYDYSEFSGSGFFETTDEYGVGLVRPKDGFEGSYDLLVTVEMTENWNGTGTNDPKTVTIYGRRRAVYYVNVSTSIAIENAPTHVSGSLEGFVDTSIYDYRFEAFQQSEALAPETSFVSQDGTSAKAFADILEEVYRSTGSYLQDITTGRIFTPMEFYKGSGATYEPQGSMALYLWKPGN